MLLAKTVSAQLNIFARAGVQNTDIRVSLTQTTMDKYKGERGWYAGGQIEYVTPEKVVVFGGAAISTIRYEQTILHMADADATNNYKLLFLELPFGFGYQLRPGKKINLNLYLGGYYNIGITGKTSQFWRLYYFSSGPGYSEYKETNKIRFGKEGDNHDDFRKTNSGLQTGVSIGIRNKLYFDFLYKHGISNILLKDQATYENRKFRTLSLGLKYNFLNHIKGKRSTKASSSHKKAF